MLNGDSCPSNWFRELKRRNIWELLEVGGRYTIPSKNTNSQYTTKERSKGCKFTVYGLRWLENCFKTKIGKLHSKTSVDGKCWSVEYRINAKLRASKLSESGEYFYEAWKISKLKNKNKKERSRWYCAQNGNTVHDNFSKDTTRCNHLSTGQSGSNLPQSCSTRTRINSLSAFSNAGKTWSRRLRMLRRMTWSWLQ